MWQVQSSSRQKIINMYSKLLFLLVFLLFSLTMGVNNVSAGPAGADTVGKTLDHHAPALQNKLKIRTINPGALEEYRQQPDFNYSDEPIAKGQSWWSRFWSWFWQMIRELFGKPDEEESRGLSVGSILLMVVLVGLIIYFVLKYMQLENIFRKKPEMVDIPYAESSKNIHEINFEKQIAEAVGKRNYKIAVRLHYLNTLKQLSDAGLIAWQPDKPNSVYLHELRDIKYRDPFGLLTRQFEYVCYGDFPLGEQAFENINRHFADFKRMLP